jgi:hypothetical protein
LFPLGENRVAQGDVLLKGVRLLHKGSHHNLC